jgi:hypothetical protein
MTSDYLIYTLSSYMKVRAFWHIVPCSLIGIDRSFRCAFCITIMMTVTRASETSVYSETTQSYIPEGSHCHICRRENLKFHTSIYIYLFIYLFYFYFFLLRTFPHY